MSFKQIAQKKALIMMLGVTDIFSRFDYKLPTKWYSFIDTLAVSTGVIHSTLCTVDDEARKEYEEFEENIERQLGLKSFYSPDDIKEIKEQVEKEADAKSRI